MWARYRIFAIGVSVKYGASTAVSLILGTTPVILKGPRHLLSFFVALALCQFLPGDYVYHVAHHSPRMQLVMATCSSIYTLRKLLYVVTFFDGRDIWASWAPALGVALIAVDGGSVTRRLENVFTNRGVKFRRLGRELQLALCYFWDRNATLLLFVSGLHLTSNTCFTLAGPQSPPGVEKLACYLHLMAKAATLSLLLFRKRVWLARKGNSHLWCSGGCYLYESGPSSSDKPAVVHLPLRLQALNLATTTSHSNSSSFNSAADVITPTANDHHHRPFKKQHFKSSSSPSSSLLPASPVSFPSFSDTSDASDASNMPTPADAAAATATVASTSKNSNVSDGKHRSEVYLTTPDRGGTAARPRRQPTAASKLTSKKKKKDQ